MLRFRGSAETLLPGLLTALLLFMPGCAQEEAPPEDPPASAATIQFPGTEAGTALVAALDEAAETGQHVFVHTGADW